MLNIEELKQEGVILHLTKELKGQCYRIGVSTDKACQIAFTKGELDHVKKRISDMQLIVSELDKLIL